MSCVVIRPKNDQTRGFLHLSDDAYRRAREHLKSAGIQVEDLQPLNWPEDAVSAYQKHMYAPWQYTTRTDIKRRRQEKAKKILWLKREYKTTQRRALYVWVFWCPGISGIFEGWWIYLVGIGHNYRSGGHKGQVDGKLLDDLLRLFPLVEPDLFEINWDKWMKKFVKKYHRGNWGGKPQGKAPIWAEVSNGPVEKILGRAKWPKKVALLRRPADPLPKRKSQERGQKTSESNDRNYTAGLTLNCQL